LFIYKILNRAEKNKFKPRVTKVKCQVEIDKNDDINPEKCV